MKIRTLVPDSFAANCYLLTENSHAFVVDPGVSVAAIETALREENATLDGILLTHGHFDHVLSLDPLRERFLQAVVYLHPDDAVTLTRDNAFSVFFGQERSWTIDSQFRMLREGDDLFLGGVPVSYLHTPGHTPGSVCYRAGNFLLTGDTVFENGYGRCDLPGGDYAALTHSIADLSELPGDLIVYPGHGGSTSLRDALFNLGFATKN